MPAKTSASRARSPTSPASSRTLPVASASPRCVSRGARSKTTTSAAPAASRRSTMCEPTKPAPPVTRNLLPSTFGLDEPSPAGPAAGDDLFAASVPTMSEPEGLPRSRRPLAEARRGPADMTETTPIFAEIASAWFASDRPVPVDWELGERPDDDLLPVSAPVPPTRPGLLDGPPRSAPAPAPALHLPGTSDGSGRALVRDPRGRGMASSERCDRRASGRVDGGRPAEPTPACPPRPGQCRICGAGRTGLADA